MLDSRPLRILHVWSRRTRGITQPSLINTLRSQCPHHTERVLKDTAQMGSSYLLLLLACVLFTCSSTQRSCRGRCGDAYYRGSVCQCDYECLSHNECCKNFESICTSRDSCKGRCGERFKRGRQCHCDSECVKFNQCCPDYETQCRLEECSAEEESIYPDVTTLAPEDDYDPETEVINEATSFPDIVSGSEPLPSAAPEENAMDPSEVKPPVLPVEMEPNELLNVTLKPEESSPPHSEDLITSVPSTNISSTLLPTTQALKEITDMKGSPVPKEDAETQPASESEDLSSSFSASTLSTEVTSSAPTTTQKPSDQRPTTLVQVAASNPTKASEKPEQNTPKKPLSTLEPIPPTTILSNLSDLKPSNAEQKEHMPAQEDNPGPQIEKPLPEPRENANPGEATIPTLNPEEKPSTFETADIKENKTDLPYLKEPYTTPAPVKVDLTPTKTPENPAKEEVIPEDNPRDYQADANNDTNLCSGRPVNGLTTLRNGTIVVFRGHYFWTLDSRRNFGHAQRITDVWGIPSPIDTVYTRCNCQGKTYFFKGDNYWRFENGIMDPNFPRPISMGFGLTGHIMAALSMPQYRSRKESVFFFKKGGLAQRYSYLIAPQCGRNLAGHTVMKKVKRQADAALGQEIDISKSWRGFPSTVTSAVSMPSTGGDGYKYYIFSRSKYYSVKMEADTPVVLTPRGGPGHHKSAKSWFRCPEN